MVLLVWLVVLAAVPSEASATTVLPSDFHSLVSRSGVAFAGTVSKKVVEQVPNSIVTHVEFTKVTFAKGGPRGGKTQLTLSGGAYGGKRQVSAGIPEFDIGKRYIVLAYADWGSEKNSYLPVVGLLQGCFRVEVDSLRSASVVLDYARRPIVGVEHHRLVVVLVPSEDPGTRMTESSFLDAIRELAGAK